MESLKTRKCLPWQVTECIDDRGKIIIEIKYYYRGFHGGFNFKAFKKIYCSPDDWEKLKKWIRGK